MTIRIMRYALVAALALCATALGASPAYAAETADWLPLKGTYGNAIGCTWNNGCPGGYHGYEAIDFLVDTNTEIYAAGPGTVTSYGGCRSTNSPDCNGSAGNYVVISHPDGRQSLYMHLSRIVKTSGSVSRGDLIGYSGASGFVVTPDRPPHLHYEERINGSHVAPGPMKAVHGSSLKQYPHALGDYTNWSSVPQRGGHEVKNDSFEPPSVSNPFGNFETIKRAPGGARISGWAIDPNTTGAIRVDTYGGTGSPSGSNHGVKLTADDPRPDVGNAYPRYGPNHGYNGKINLPYGSHKVCSYAIDVGKGSNEQIGCKSINITPHPFGNLEKVEPVPGGVEVEGWSIDPDTASPIDVHLYGDSGSPGKSLVADESRLDVKQHYEPYGDRHGYKAFFELPAGEHKVCAYGINAKDTQGSNPQLGCKEVYVSPHPFGNLDTVQPVDGGVMVTGWAIDPDTTSAIDVHLYGGSGSPGGGNPGMALIADKSRSDVGDVYPRYGDLHGYEEFFSLPSGQQTVCAYGINANNTPGSNRQIGCKTVTVP